MAREFAVPDTMSPSLEAPCARTSANIGEMAERFKAAVLKTAVGVSLPWVRIPLSPPPIKKRPFGRFFMGGGESDLRREPRFDKFVWNKFGQPQAGPGALRAEGFGPWMGRTIPYAT